MLPTLLATSPASVFSRPADPNPELEARVAALEARVVELEAQLAKHGTVAPSAAREAEAKVLYEDAQDAFEAGRFDDTRSLLATLDAQYEGTRAERMSQRLAREVAVIGRRVPDDWANHIETWYTRRRGVDLTQGLVVALYWESWCPHCKREIPKWEQTWQQYKGDGLQVLGLTRITRSATIESAHTLIDEAGITFPMAKEDGSLAELADVSGIPAAAVFRDGELIWRGHPARIDDTLLHTWLQLP